MSQPSQIPDAKKAVGEILKGVDRLIKAGKIDESIREIMLAKEIDPKHGYIRAYEERLSYLKQEHEKNIEQERTRKEAEEAARLRDEQLRKQHEEERKRLEENRKREEHQIRAQQKRTETAEREQAGPHQIEREMTDGSVGVSKERGLKPLISDTPAKSGRKSVLVVDDEEEMLQMISQALVSAGYETRSLTSSDEAYVLLKTWVPDLILCDINLRTSTMGGFSFLEKVRALDHLLEVPFVFLTGLTDEMILRKAKELGADDYLVKPISIENLLATITGKLKRFGTFQRKP